MAFNRTGYPVSLQKQLVNGNLLTKEGRGRRCATVRHRTQLMSR